jgi:hypothetical protein
MCYQLAILYSRIADWQSVLSRQYDDRTLIAVSFLNRFDDASEVDLDHATFQTNSLSPTIIESAFKTKFLFATWIFWIWMDIATLEFCPPFHKCANNGSPLKTRLGRPGDG